MPRWIKSHHQTGQDRQCDGEAQNGDGESGAGVIWFEWKKIRRNLRNERDQLPREDRANDSREDADKQAFENKKPQHASTRCAQRDAQRDLASSSAEAHEQ